MSNKEPQNQEKTTEEAAVEKRRRFIKGAGVAAPVVLSLANRSAFGAAQQCLSQQVSGNMSHVGAGSCASGKSPTMWRGPNPVGNNITDFDLVSTEGPKTTTVINKQVKATFTGNTGGTTGEIIRIVVTKEVTIKIYRWHGTGRRYGVLTTTKATTTINRVAGLAAAVTTEVTVTNARQGGSPNINNRTVIVGAKFTAGTISEYTGANPPRSATAPATLPAAICSDFTGGATFNAAFGYGPATPMRAILCANPGSDDSHCVAAMLNALTITNYVANVPQVKLLCSTPPGCPVPPGYTNLTAFLASTWLNVP